MSLLLSLLLLSYSVIDLINIVAVTVFGVQHRFNDGFTYGQSFWLTVCSTIASSITNITVILDYARTPDFARSGESCSRRAEIVLIPDLKGVDSHESSELWLS